MMKAYWLKVVDTGSFWVRVIAQAGRHYGRLHSSLLAASISYYALMCLAPLAILSVVALQAWVGSDEAYERLQQLLGAVFPAPGQILGLLGQGIRQPHAVFGGVVGLVALGWAALRLFEAIERGLSVIWADRPQRGIVIRKLMAMVTLVGVGVLGGAFMLTMSLTAWLRRIMQQTDTGSELLARIHWHPHYTVLLAVFVLSLLALFTAYKFLPEGRASNRAALLAAVSTAVLAQVAGRLFNFTVAGIVQLSIIYGALTWVVIFCLWAYFGASILLFGAHLGRAYDIQSANAKSMPDPQPVATSSDNCATGG